MKEFNKNGQKGVDAKTQFSNSKHAAEIVSSARVSMALAGPRA
jgi:hypothetical protein